MRLLYNDDFAPITSSIGFLAADGRRVAETFSTWTGRLEANKGRGLVSTQVVGSLDKALTSLLPLTTHDVRRSVFVPTRSDWTAYFDNSVLGTDASPVVSHMALLLQCRSIRITAISDDREAHRPKGKRDAAVIFELFERHNTDWLNNLRGISMMNDGRWIFEADGTVQPFEEPENYKKPKIKDRFTIEMLDRYLRAMGIRAFEEDFYMPPGTEATLFEKTGTPPKGMKEYDLAGSLGRFE